jgi:PAS domain S-box-containing protein
MNVRLFNLTQDLIAVETVNGRLTWANPAFTNILGYTESEYIDHLFIDFVFKDDQEETRRAQIEQLRGAGNLTDFEIRHVCKNGMIRWLSWTAVWDRQDDVDYAVARDVTEFKIHAYLLDLHRLDMANTSKFNALGRMAAGIAH